MPDRNTIETIFLEAVELPADQLASFLDRRCGGDRELRDAVMELIEADRQAGDGAFLRSQLFTKDNLDEAATPIPDRPTNDDADRFRILRAYRQGGLGEVLLAHDRQLDRDVAIKQIKPRWADSEEARQRFIQEAKVTGRLEHPGIVPVYAMGTWPDGQHYYAMRFIEGDTMKDSIDRYHRPLQHSDSTDVKGLQLRELLSRFVDVCNTIQYAHSKRVLHRDIKPSNIMVGPYGETLVVDWGLAKLLDEPVEESMTADLARAIAKGSGSTPTRIGGTVGTPQYMSPEQAQGKLESIGTRTDVYLLGATLYQILTGRPPHQDDSISRLLKKIAAGTLTRPRQIAADIAPPLESICLKAMAADPSDRYADPNQIADDVHRWMADQAVSVHKDPVSVRVNRWMRRHRTATSTLAVTLLLLAIGGVFGSILWNVANVRKLQAEQERRSKRLELDAKDRQRIAELQTTADAAETLAAIEVSRDRYTSALNVLRNTLPGVRSEPRLIEQADRIEQQADRIESLVDFYALAETVEQQNVLSRDTKALLACTTALKRLGIWDRTDWWTGLPDQDLSAEQIDRLRWDVYQQLMLMDAMLVKSIGIRLTGEGRVGGPSALLRAAGRLLTTNAGKAEAEAALVVSDRIDRFRLSESTRLYRSIANMRLGTGARLQGKDLGQTRNGPDAHSLAVLSMIAAIDPSFKLVFRGYQGDDALLTARDLFGRSAALNPNYYGTHLGLGQVHYLIAQRISDRRPDDLQWEDLAPALHSFGQCITLLPQRCFAFADRSSIYRWQARLIADDERYSPAERRRRATERLQWSLEDAQRAMQSYDVHPWVGWQAGQAFAELAQVDRALQLWIQTAIDTYPLGEIADMRFVAVDDLRGRAAIGDWLQQQLARPESQIRFNPVDGFTALAGVRLNQTRQDEALAAIESALDIDPNNLHARAIRGMILLRQRGFETAESDFQAVCDADPDHPLGTFGLAQCREHEGRLSEAAEMFSIAEHAALTGENQAAAALGRCRTAALSGDLAAAEAAVGRAIDLEPACDLLASVRSIATELSRRKRSPDVDEMQIAALEAFIKSLAKLPRATKIDVMPAADPRRSSAASILNGGFELDSIRYWNSISGAKWETTPGFASSAQISPEAHSGNRSLRLTVSAADGDGVANASGRTGQEFSVVAGQRYRLSCWAKAERLAAGAMRIVGPAGETLIEFDPGSYDWRRVAAPLIVTQTADGRRVAAGTIVPVRIQIVARGDGTLWLDDFMCQSTP
ncbi:Serine/threonine-protein kinase PknD [Stieleria neptunia]|uniref:Serine/threonine-protein kinase PknD n=1 Tax=Stieleria neptunia TaxID=2527979 RepID=A0A518I2R3_9BACT|nr:serine/threonine-protein kinase [Stieleria neptunia]QDV47378.1 Serine/threonine-protein kinase PknD [Stieleria neptunia]